MKKKVVIGIGAGMILLIGLLFYFEYPNKEEYDITQEKQITFISSLIKNLEECQGYSKFSPREKALEVGYSQFCFDSTDIDNTNLSKLEALENLKGILIDENISSNYNYYAECNLLWEFNYQKVVVRLNHATIRVYECKDKFYITSSSYPGPPTVRAYRIRLSEEIINKLKE
ncbi:hypothetical protein LDC_0031 [sediment metagenome]|uniref:Uncharacterized protein n=1 Tax=sediment metagenome TaxID=749907 RepID=D9PEV3_9ZZZZ